MRIIKQLNNNIVVAADEQGHEIVLMGKGIGFGARPGMEADLTKVEKKFVGLSSEKHTRQLAELLERIPTAHLELGMEIAKLAQERIGKPLNETLVLMLSDHVSFAIEREKKGMSLENALLWEIRKFYPDEYKIGQEALGLIERETGVGLSEDEVGFIAMHVVNAQYGDGVPVAQDILQLMQDVINLVRYTYAIDLDEDSLDYIRFVTHLKFFLARVINWQALDGKGFTPQVKTGDRVKAGQLLLKFDIDYIKSQNLPVTTPMVVTNTDDFSEVKPLITGKVDLNTRLLQIKK